MTYGESQKRATYRYRAKIRDTEAFKEKTRQYCTKSYAKSLENPTKIAHRYDVAKWVRYYAADYLRDIRRLFA